MYVYRPDSLEPEITERPFQPYRDLKEELKQVLGAQYAEHVSVLFKDPITGIAKPADMFVNEDGHALGLPLNRAATEIYQYFAVTQRGEDPKDMPVIAGTAVVFDAPVWS